MAAGFSGNTFDRPTCYSVIDGSSIRPNHSMNVKYEWYQTDTLVTVSMLVKNVVQSRAAIEFFQQSFSAAVETEGGVKTLELNLAKQIVPSLCTFRILSSKVELKLHKRLCEVWPTLECIEEVKPCVAISNSRNWDQLVETELKDDKSESDAALNELFQKIYSQGSDEVKKAMNKSFLESGGTVLSTNWKEVARDTVEIKPPDGMEWKKWDS